MFRLSDPVRSHAANVSRGGVVAQECPRRTLGDECLGRAVALAVPARVKWRGAPPGLLPPEIPPSARDWEEDGREWEKKSFNFERRARARHFDNDNPLQALERIP